MLVLSRKSTERIQIGNDVVVTVLEIHGNKVRIGISAPRHIRVLRSELTEVIAEAAPDLVSNGNGLGTTHVEKVFPSVVYS